MRFLDFQGKKWIVVAKVKAHHVQDSSTLKDQWKCDMVIKDKTQYWMLDEIIDAEFEEIK